MINPDFYTTQHIELEVAELDIDEGLKDVILATLERYEQLKAELAEVNDPVYWYRNYINLEAERDQLKAKLAESDDSYWKKKSENWEHGFNELCEIWRPVDQFVRPLTSLGKSVTENALSLLIESKELKSKLSELEKQDPIGYAVEVYYQNMIDPAYCGEGLEIYSLDDFKKTDRKITDENVFPVYASPVQSPAISKMETTTDGLNLRLIEDCLLIYKTQLYSDDWSGLRDKVSEQIDILAKLNKQGA